MASTFSPSLKLELIGNGDQSGTWGTTTNTNLGTLLEQAITGVQAITMVNANYTLSDLNGVSDEARNAVLVVGGTNSAIRNIIAPSVNKTYIIANNTVGGFAIIIKTAVGTGLSIANGATQTVYCDGSEFYAASFPSTGGAITGNLSVSGTLSVTGATTLSNTVSVNSSVGTAGQLFTSRGAGLSPEWASAATVFTTGMIMLWSGSIGTIPSGWLLCNGSSGTPDLRNRFIVGAGTTYAVNDIGGSADAVLVSHNHTASSSSNSIVSDPSHRHVFGADDQVASQGGYDIVGGFEYDARSSAGGSGVNLLTKNTSLANAGEKTGISVNTSTTTTNTATGVSGTGANLPPYYALAYIMKS